MRRNLPSLAIVGAYPPPHGGVTTHTRRLCSLLDAAAIRYVVYNAVSEAADGERVISVCRHRSWWLAWYLFFGKERAVYFMSARPITWVTAGLMATMRRTRVMVRLQNEVLIDLSQRRSVARTIVGFALRQMDGIVCVSRSLADAAVRMGVKSARVYHYPGYLPPAAEEHERSSVAPAVWEFIAERGPVIAANGKVDRWHGEDLYGLDHLVELAARLKADYPKLGVVVCFWDFQPQDKPAVDALLEQAASRGVADNILFNTTGGLFVPVLDAADVFVRPTNTDGDANSIREALQLGVPCVASDAVERPAGTILFPTRDIDDFEKKVRVALGEEREKDRSRSAESDGRQKITSYVELLKAFAGNPPNGSHA